MLLKDLIADLALSLYIDYKNETGIITSRIAPLKRDIQCLLRASPLAGFKIQWELFDIVSSSESYYEIRCCEDLEKIIMQAISGLSGYVFKHRLSQTKLKCTIYLIDKFEQVPPTKVHFGYLYDKSLYFAKPKNGKKEEKAIRYFTYSIKRLTLQECDAYQAWLKRERFLKKETSPCVQVISIAFILLIIIFFLGLYLKFSKNPSHYEKNQEFYNQNYQNSQNNYQQYSQNNYQNQQNQNKYQQSNSGQQQSNYQRQQNQQQQYSQNNNQNNQNRQQSNSWYQQSGDYSNILLDGYYQILGISKGSKNLDEINKAFREKSKIFHPDKCVGGADYCNRMYADIVTAKEKLVASISG